MNFGTAAGEYSQLFTIFKNRFRATRVIAMINGFQTIPLQTQKVFDLSRSITLITHPETRKIAETNRSPSGRGGGRVGIDIAIEIDCVKDRSRSRFGFGFGRTRTSHGMVVSSEER